MPLPLEIFTECNHEGRLPKKYAKRIGEHLRLFADREVCVRVSSPKRSGQANRFYWMCINLIRAALNDAGVAFLLEGDSVRPVTSEALHEYFKARYLPMQTLNMGGEEVTLIPTTTTLDRTQFFDYVQSVQNDDLVLQLGIVFPEPDSGFRSYAIKEAA